MNNEKYCLFCLDIIPNSEFREIEIDFGCSCKINYHNECMDIWLSSHRFASCPLCRNRQPIDNNITIIISQTTTNHGISHNDIPFILPFMLVICMFTFVLILVFYCAYMELS